jgi:two-component system sensor kinase FixL
VQAAEQYLNQAPPPLSEVREILSDIAADGRRAGNVIQRLRALYQKIGQERTAVQLNKVIRDTIELMRSEFVLKEVSLQLDLDAALPTVSGDYVQLQLVVINLIVNALDAMAARQSGARRLHIGTACGEPNTVRVSVRDSGTGLSVEQLGRVGEPFFTTKPAGMGMGLAISRSILEAHGGRLWAENDPDCGATFHLALPVFSDSSA